LLLLFLMDVAPSSGPTSPHAARNPKFLFRQPAQARGQSAPILIESYDLVLDVGFREGLIHGTATIHLLDSEDPFELDAQEMSIESVQVDGKPAPFELGDRVVRVSLLSGHGDHTITLRYQKEASDNQSKGVYKSRYGSEYFIATDFEPDRAKYFFPCKDDPTWKAVFNLQVVTEAGLQVISNSPVARVEDAGGDGRKRFVFEPTPRMSTYLFFVGIGKFSETSLPSHSRNAARVILAGRPESAQRSAFILETAAAALAESERYFGFPYPLKKLHLIALPEYGGAMENWGAITSYEGGLLVGDDASALDRRRAAITTTHEIQHQWFGDLVTMKWWDDIWLNEGFATFMSYKMVDRIHPEWGCWGDFLNILGFESMKVDQLHATHPIRAKVSKPAEINEIFDFISYGKGASILRMIEAFLGEDAFGQGISNYIRKFAYSNAAGEDLWGELGKASSQPVASIMGTWIRKSGFPLVSVSREGSNLRFEQRRFLLGGEESEEDRQPWPVPVTMQVDGKLTRFLFTERSQTFKAGHEPSQLKVNSGQTGYYCVKYADEFYEHLAASFPRLSGLDKAGVVNDLFQLLKAGEVEPGVYYRFVGLCGDVDDYTTVYQAFRQLRILSRIGDGSRGVSEATLSFLRTQMARIGLSSKPGESENTGIIRGFVANLLARLDEKFANDLAGKFSNYQAVDPNLKPAVAVAFARTTGEKAYGRLEQMIEGSENESDREKLYQGLTAFDDPQTVRKAMDFGASGKVSRSDTYWTLLYSSWNPKARRAAWDWIKSNYDRMPELIGGPTYVLTLLQETVPLIAVEDEADARSFFSREGVSKGGIRDSQILELLSVYSRLRKRLT
jgi:tricorn protease interacting factor F2/3